MKIYIGVTGKAFTAGCFSLALASRAMADDFANESPLHLYLFAANQIYIMPTSGTLGHGFELRYSLSDNFKMRFQQASQEISETNARNDVHYNLNLKIMSNSTLVDWHVFGGRFRTSLGVIRGKTELTANAYSTDMVAANWQTTTGSNIIAAANSLDPAQSYTFGAWTITGAQLAQYAATLDPNLALTTNQNNIYGSSFLQASAVARYPGYAPYLGFGWGSYEIRKTGFLYSVDVGVMYLGKPKVELTATGPVADLARQYYPAELESYLAGEKQKIEDALKEYRYYPVVAVGIWYRF